MSSVVNVRSMKPRQGPSTEIGACRRARRHHGVSEHPDRPDGYLLLPHREQSTWKRDSRRAAFIYSRHGNPTWPREDRLVGGGGGRLGVRLGHGSDLGHSLIVADEGNRWCHGGHLWRHVQPVQRVAPVSGSRPLSCSRCGPRTRVSAVTESTRLIWSRVPPILC